MNEVLEELRELEQIGPRALDLLLDLAKSELNRIPELRKDRSKTYDDYALGFFAESGAELLTAALLQAEDDDAVGRMFHTWLHRFEIADRCSSCREPRCPEGHCECTLAAELRCGKCFLMKHRTQFKASSTVCKECCE